jgi:hypothetical protein
MEHIIFNCDTGEGGVSFSRVTVAAAVAVVVAAVVVAAVVVAAVVAVVAVAVGAAAYLGGAAAQGATDEDEVDSAVAMETFAAVVEPMALALAASTVSLLLTMIPTITENEVGTQRLTQFIPALSLKPLT